MGERRPRRREFRVWLFAGGYLLLGLALCAVAATVEPRFDPPFHLPWWVFAALFAVTERFTVDLEVRREAHTLSFTEVATTLGLIFAVPGPFIAARVVSSVAVLLIYRRPQAVKLVFNSGVFTVDVGLSVLLFHALLGEASPIRPAGWLAALAAVGIAHVVGAIAVFFVIGLAGAPVKLRKQAIVAGVSLSAALSGSAVALGAAAVLWLETESWILLTLIAAALGYFFVSFVKIRERHLDLSMLHSFTTRLQGAEGQLSATTIAATMAELLRAQLVVLLLPSDAGSSVLVARSDGDVEEVVDVDQFEWLSALGVAGRRGAKGDPNLRIAGIETASDDVMSTRLPMPNRAGLVIVDGRESVARAFDDEDLQLLETAAGHAAAALTNFQLVERLRQEAAFRAHQALHDDITELPNQRALVERLDGHLSHGLRLIVLTLRIHSLREVNETLGRAMGDEMLCKVAERIARVGDRSWCARSGTDEFTLIVPGGHEDAEAVARQIVDAFDQPVLCNDVALAVTVGIGVALAPQHGTEAEMLVRRASLAASRSAIEGTTVTTWAADRDPYDPQRLTIAADLRDAIPAGELEVQFQPQVDMKTGEVTGAEALVRWAHPRLGQLRPDQFIAAAEHTGAIDALTFHVLTVATETGQRWRERGWDLEMAVNLSARNLTSPRFAAEVATILDRTGFPAESLTLELTESSVMTEAGRALATLDELSVLGVSLSIDDFGTGYSSLAHLRRLPVNEIKIDKSFVFDLTTNESDEAIVRSMVELGHTLSMRVVVEGVETVEVRDRLEKIGSDRLQGYLVSRPLAAAAFEHWMQERRVRASVEPARRVVQLQPRR